MNVLQLYNDYRSSHGGEGPVVEMIAATIEKHGGRARLLTRSSKGLDQSLTGKVRAFASGFYNRSAYREVETAIAQERPDIVHAHNLYPLFSPSVLVACRRAGVPVVMTHHNYLLTCPVTNHLHRGSVCEKCLGGHEQWCVLKNCRGNLVESVAYALRSATARKRRLFLDNVTLHIVLSEFAKRRLVKIGFDAERIAVLPNMVQMDDSASRSPVGQYVAFSGRMAPEKGVDVLLEAAKRLPDVPFRLAGDGPMLEQWMAATPPQATFLKRLDRTAMADFYNEARFLVVPSRWFEGCPLVVSEAMSRGLPVVASRIGGLPEFVEDGVTGLLFEPGNASELTEKIRLLWDNPTLCRRLGEAGREKARREYGEARYHERLTEIYQCAIQHESRTRAVTPRTDRMTTSPPLALSTGAKP